MNEQTNPEIPAIALDLLTQISFRRPIAANDPATAISAVRHARPGTPITLILPMTSVSGGTRDQTERGGGNAASWNTFRHQLLTQCHRIKVITCSTYDVTPGNLSAMALIAAAKVMPGENPDHQVLHIGVDAEPETTCHAETLAQRIRAATRLQTPGATLRWDPSDKAPSSHAVLVECPPGTPWKHARILDPDTLNAGQAIQQGRIGHRYKFKTDALQNAAPVASNAVGRRPENTVLIPTTIRWNTNALTAHLADDDPLPRKLFYGLADNPEIRDGLRAWLNTTMGLLTLWSVGTHIQNGRTYFTLGNLDRLGLPDTDMLPRLSAVQPDGGFEQLLNASEAWQDEARTGLDLAVLDAMRAGRTARAVVASARARWCLEPTVLGNRGTQADTVQEIRKSAPKALNSSVRATPLSNITKAARSILLPPKRR